MDFDFDLIDPDNNRYEIDECDARLASGKLIIAVNLEGFREWTGSYPDNNWQFVISDSFNVFSGWIDKAEVDGSQNELRIISEDHKKEERGSRRIGEL